MRFLVQLWVVWGFQMFVCCGGLWWFWVGWCFGYGEDQGGVCREYSRFPFLCVGHRLGCYGMCSLWGREFLAGEYPFWLSCCLVAQYIWASRGMALTCLGQLFLTSGCLILIFWGSWGMFFIVCTYPCCHSCCAWGIRSSTLHPSVVWFIHGDM